MEWFWLISFRYNIVSLTPHYFLANVFNMCQVIYELVRLVLQMDVRFDL